MRVTTHSRRSPLRRLGVVVSLSLLLLNVTSSFQPGQAALILAVAAADPGVLGRANSQQQMVHSTRLLATESLEIVSPGDDDDEDTPQTTATDSELSVSKYHLLWSPGVWKKIAIGTSTLFVAHATSNFVSWSIISDLSSALLLKSTSSLAASLGSNVLLPMLASACCLLQLGLNLLSIGCAGFNTVLGPVRPYFISLLLYLTVVSRSSHHASLGSWAASTALRWSLALLPEALHFYNNNRERFLLPRRKQSVLATPRKLEAVVHLEIPTMGCVACINKIDKALSQVGDQVISAKSTLHEISGGQAQVKIAADSHSEVHATVASLTNAVDKAGFFGSKVESVEVHATKTT